MTTVAAPTTLAEIWQVLWDDLHSGVHNRHHPFHTAILGSATLAGGADVRIVVVRGIDPSQGLIRCHTDLRSPKVAQIKQQPEIAWLLYNPENRNQIRLRGKAVLHHNDDTAQAAWEASTLLARRCYCGFAPGTEQPQPHTGLPDELQDRQPTEEESTLGRVNFAVIECEITAIDWLLLHFEGHVRAQFSRASVASEWDSRWVTP